MRSEEHHQPRIPICLVTGFLGSGKTTFLKGIAQRYPARRLVYLINEFSNCDIDGALVSAEHPDVISIPGGSIFCQCLVTEFMARLQEIPRRFGSIEGVIIEASGMANPKVMNTMLRETRLDTRYRLANVIAIVDPGSFSKLRVTLPNITAQIEAATIALINKTDCYPSDMIASTQRDLIEMNPRLIIIPCVQGHAPVDLFDELEHPDGDKAGGSYAKCRDPGYETVSIQPPPSIPPDTLQNRLFEVEEEIYRLKGYIESAGQTFYVDYSKSGFSATPSSPPSGSGLVLIHKGNPSSVTQLFVEWLNKNG